MNASGNREYKASLFSTLFGKPEKALELYNAIEGLDYKDISMEQKLII